MRLPLAIATMLMCAMPGANAQGLSIGTAIICDTSEQAQRFVKLRNTGNETVQALQLINTEAKTPTACGAAVVAFRRGEAIGSERIGGERVDLVKITVVAFNNGAGWSPVPATVQYAIIAPPGIEA
jgi:hypothetical protein